MADQMTAPAVVQSNGGGALADEVLKSPQHGAGYFFAPTAAGTSLALFGFGLSLAMLSMVQAEWLNLGAIRIVSAAALSYGTVALVLAGMMEFRANNMFGATWAITYGCFWLSLGLILQFLGPQITTAVGAEAFADAFGTYLIMWGVITACLAACAYYVATPAFLAFVLLTAVFGIVGWANLAAPGDFADTLRQVGGYVGIVNAAVAIYLATALVLNETSGRQVLKIWPYTPREKRVKPTA